MTVAALYVQTGGTYYGLDDVDPWDEARDARLYEGPWPVVGHRHRHAIGRTRGPGGLAMAQPAAELLERAILLIRHEWGYDDPRVREWLADDDAGWAELRDEVDRHEAWVRDEMPRYIEEQRERASSP